MAIVVGGSWSSATPSPRTELVAKVVQLYGAAGEDDIEKMAVDFLDDRVKELNLQLFDFNKVYVTGQTLTASTATISLPTDFYRESQAWLVKTSDSTQQVPLSFLGWAEYNRTYGYKNSGWNSIPIVYTVRNAFNDGLLTLSPTPDTKTATDYTLTIHYYRRIPLVSESDPLTIPQEAEPTLIFGAQKHLAMHLMGAGHPDVAALEHQEYESVRRLRELDVRHPDENFRFLLKDSVARPFTVVPPGYVVLR